MSINLMYDPDSTFLAAGLTQADIANMRSANAYVVSQLQQIYTDPVNINIHITAVPGTNTLGQSTSFLLPVSFDQLHTAEVADARTTDDATAVGSNGSLTAYILCDQGAVKGFCHNVK